MQTIYVSENPVESFPSASSTGQGRYHYPPVVSPSDAIGHFTSTSHGQSCRCLCSIQGIRLGMFHQARAKTHQWFWSVPDDGQRSTVLISKKQHVSSWASLSSFHPTLCQGSIKDVISAAQSGGDSKSPMQSPVIATTSGKPIHQTGGKTKKHNDNYFFLYTPLN